MESHGVAGRVQVSESSRLLLGEPFVLEERGVLEVEGKGEFKTWFVSGRNGASHQTPTEGTRDASSRQRRDEGSVVERSS
jgi:hypothetical protein